MRSGRYGNRGDQLDGNSDSRSAERALNLKEDAEGRACRAADSKGVMPGPPVGTRQSGVGLARPVLSAASVGVCTISEYSPCGRRRRLAWALDVEEAMSSKTGSDDAKYVLHTAGRQARAGVPGGRWGNIKVWSLVKPRHK